MDISVASVASLHPALTQGIQDSPDLNRVLSLGELFSSKQADEPIGPNDAENAENLAIHLSSASAYNSAFATQALINTAKNRALIIRAADATREFKVNLVHAPPLDQTTLITDMHAMMTAFRDDMTAMRTDITTLRTGVTTLQTNGATLQTSITKLQADGATLQTSVTKLQADFTTIQTDLAEVKELAKLNRIDTANMKIVRKNRSLYSTSECLRKTVSGDGHELAQKACGLQALPADARAYQPGANLDDIFPGFDANFANYRAIDILKLMIFYNEDFSIVEADGMDVRKTKIRNWLLDI